jgi:hypothetical protein
VQATYDVRRSPIQALAVTFAISVSLILGGTGGFLLKGHLQASIVSLQAPVVAPVTAHPMTNPGRGQHMTRLELQDQQSQAQAIGSSSTVSRGAESNRAGTRYGPQ